MFNYKPKNVNLNTVVKSISFPLSKYANVYMSKWFLNR